MISGCAGSSLLPGCSSHCNEQGPLSLSVINSRSLLKFMSIDSVVSSNHLILYHPLLLPPSIFTSIRIFSKKPVFHIRWPNYLSFNCSINPSNEHSGLISLKMDWLDLLAVQGILKSLIHTTVQKHQFSVFSFLYSPTLTSIHD